MIDRIIGRLALYERRHKVFARWFMTNNLHDAVHPTAKRHLHNLADRIAESLRLIKE